MDGIGIPILGALVALQLFLLCLAVPKIRPYAFAALVSPFAARIVFIFGAFVLDDMNPVREGTLSYLPNAFERAPTKIDVGLWLLSVLATFAVSAVICVRLQRVAIASFQHLWKKPSPTSGSI